MSFQRFHGESAASLNSYQPPTYIEEEWEVVKVKEAQNVEVNSFVPASFDTVESSGFQSDPMFSNFTTEPEVPSATQGQSIELDRESGDFDLQPVGDLLEVADSQGVTLESDVGGEVTELIEPDEGAEATQENPQQSSGELVQIDEARLREALQASYDQGLAEARQEVEKMQQQLEERYRLLFEDMQTQAEESVKLHEAKAVELALQVARKMIGDVVSERRDYVLGVIKEAIKASGGAQIKSIRVSPNDYEFLKLGGYSESDKIVQGGSLSFVSDDSIRSGCVLSTAAGEVDFDLDKAWERLRAKIVQDSRA